jgi:hypothetical protein
MEILKWMNAPNALKVGRKCSLPAPVPPLRQILELADPPVLKGTICSPPFAYSDTLPITGHSTILAFLKA